MIDTPRQTKLPVRPEMAYQTSIQVANASASSVIFHLEPWGQQISMSPGDTFTVSAESEEEGSFEVEYGEEEIIVWAWSSAIAKVFCNGKRLDAWPERNARLFLRCPQGKACRHS
jgi:hypothetical protein